MKLLNAISAILSGEIPGALKNNNVIILNDNSIIDSSTKLPISLTNLNDDGWELFDYERLYSLISTNPSGILCRILNTQFVKFVVADRYDTDGYIHALGGEGDDALRYLPFELFPVGFEDIAKFLNTKPSTECLISCSLQEQDRTTEPDMKNKSSKAVTAKANKAKRILSEKFGSLDAIDGKMKRPINKNKPDAKLEVRECKFGIIPAVDKSREIISEPIRENDEVKQEISPMVNNSLLSKVTEEFRKIGIVGEERWNDFAQYCESQSINIFDFDFTKWDDRVRALSIVKNFNRKAA